MCITRPYDLLNTKEKNLHGLNYCKICITRPYDLLNTKEKNLHGLVYG